jgi:hypothetical protein
VVVFVLGYLPFSFVMVQKSQLNGHPLEYWILMVAYLLKSSNSQTGAGVLVISGKSVLE